MKSANPRFQEVNVEQVFDARDVLGRLYKALKQQGVCYASF